MSFSNDIPIFSRKIDHIRNMPYYAISNDYLGNPLENDIYLAISFDADHLYFETRSELFSQPSMIDSGFKEGLWENEVSEIFMYNNESDTYQEFNVSPSGHYWGMTFSKYRERSQPIQQLSYSTSGSTFCLKIPLSQLSTPIDSEGCKIQIAGVIKSPPNSRTLYSSNPLKNETPDFHRKESGLGIRLL